MPQLCPQCQSDAIVLLPKQRSYLCEDCEHRWPAGQSMPRSPVSLSEAGGAAPQAFCRQLEATAAWVDEVEQQWPAPIAHEYHHLREVLADGQIVSAILQLKDLTEVLIKFPALLMTRWVEEQAGMQVLRQQLEADLLGRPLSMGAWHSLVGDRLAPALLTAADPDIARLAAWWRVVRKSPARPTACWRRSAPGATARSVMARCACG